MPIDYAALKTEIDVDPLARGYAGMTDQEITDDLNTAYRDAEGGVSGMLNYILKNRSRTNNGTDTVATSMYGRLQTVAEGTIGADPFGHGVASSNLTMEHIHAAKGFIALLNNPQVETFNYLNSEVEDMLEKLSGGTGNATVWKTADVTALQNLSKNQQTRAVELGFGLVRVGDVEYAKSL